MMLKYPLVPFKYDVTCHDQRHGNVSTDCFKKGKKSEKRGFMVLFFYKLFSVKVAQRVR